MRHLLPIIFILSLGLTFTACNQQAGCPGVRAYTSGGGVNAKSKKGNAIRNKKFQAKKGKGNDPWTKKTQKKDNKKATSGLFDKKTKKQSRQVE